MKLTRLLLILSVPLILAACSNSTTDPNPTPSGKDTVKTTDSLPVQKNVPVHDKKYDTTKGGVQIVAIYYDQGRNQDSFGLAAPEEWIVLKSDRKVETKGWWLNAGDIGQNYQLPDTINGRLYIFTQAGDVPANITTGGARMSLDLHSWLWNNADHDIATIYRADTSVVDALSY